MQLYPLQFAIRLIRPHNSTGQSNQSAPDAYGALNAFFRNQDARFRKNWTSLLKNDQPVSIQQLTGDDRLIENTLVELRVLGPSPAVER